MAIRPLEGLRVVERADGVAAAFAGRLLALLGAETVMAEPPQGSALRRAAPFLPGGATSALFAYHAAGKKSVVCSGAGELDPLLEGASVLFDDTPLAERPSRGLDPARIAARHRDLIHVSILPFGAEGPKAHWRGEELNVIHASGEGKLLPNGLSAELYPDRPPLKIAGHFAECQGGVAAALAALAALFMGKGQFVDVSVEDAALALGAFAVQRFGDGAVEHRSTRSFRYGGVVECADGYVEFLTLEERQWQALVALMGHPLWAADPAFADPLERGRSGAEINRHLRAWAKTRPVGEIVARGQAQGVPVAKYAEPADILAGAQERARGLFARVAVEGFGAVEMLAAPFRFGREPLAPKSGPPALGADRIPRIPRIQSGAGAAAQPAGEPPRAAVRGPRAAERERAMARPLEGVRILDFTLHNAGPFCTHLLSQLGAECIKVESAQRPDVFRKPHPVYGRQGAATFDQVASNKLSVRINLKHAEGVRLARRLAVLAGVVAESFRPGVMDRLGLGYQTLRRERADLVMISISSCGQSGPEASFAGYAPLFGAWGGLGTLTGYEDGPPVEMRHVMDHSVGLNAALAALAALLGRRRTGEGAHVDVAGREVAASLIGEALLLAASGERPARQGNADPGMAPHGVYPALSPDTWLTIAVKEEEAWRRLLRVMKREDLGHDPRFATLAQRLAHRSLLDAELALWTRTQGAEEAALLLQREGVAAHASRDIREVVADPHLLSRGAIIEVPEPGGGRRAAIAAPMCFSGAKGIGISRPTPALGEHEDTVFGELLGLSRAERSLLEEKGAIS